MLSSGLPEIVADDEDVARILVQPSQFGAAGVKPSAFVPGNKDRETSVFRHGREPLNSLMEIGRDVADRRSLTAYGAAVLKARSARGTALDVVASEPPARHAAIRGWPWDGPDPDLDKARRKELALLLANAAGPAVMFQRLP